MVLDITFVTYDRASGDIHSFHAGHPHGPHDATRYAVAEYRNITHQEASQEPGAWKVDLGSISVQETILPLVRLIRA